MADQKNTPTPPKKTATGEEPLEAQLVDNGEKTVTVRATEDHKCSIGGRTYIMRKLGEYQMPESDANILQLAGKVIKK